MKNIKDKIKKIEDAEKLISRLSGLAKTCQKSHIDPAVCFVNGDTLHDAVIIDADLFDLVISTQIKTLEASIKDDKAFVMGIEMMLSKESQGGE